MATTRPSASSRTRATAAAGAAAAAPEELEAFVLSLYPPGFDRSKPHEQVQLEETSAAAAAESRRSSVMGNAERVAREEAKALERAAKAAARESKAEQAALLRAQLLEAKERARRAAQEAKEAAAKRARHQAAIAAAEQLLHDLHLDAQPRSTSLKGFGAFLRHDSLSAKTLMRLLANLRLHVHDVRIVLEEDNLLPRSPFAIGLTIDSVSLLPPDDDAEPPVEPSSPGATATAGASSASGATSRTSSSRPFSGFTCLMPP